MIGHTMVDIEALGNGPIKAVCQIGWCHFSLETGEVEDAKIVNIELGSLLKAGFQVDGRTLKWWLTQSEEARNSLFDPEPKDVREAFKEFGRDIEFGQRYVWGLPAEYDCQTLAESFVHLGMQVPWRRKDSMCARTVQRMLWLQSDRADMKPLDRVGIHHHAGWDAYNQAP